MLLGGSPPLLHEVHGAFSSRSGKWRVVLGRAAAVQGGHCVTMKSFFFVGVALASNFLSCFREPLCCFLSPTVLCWLLTTEAASCLTFLGLCFSAVCGHGRGDHGAIVAVFNMTTVLPSLFSSIGKGEMWANIFVNLVFTEFSFPKIESVLSSLNAGKGSIYSSLYLFSDT